MILRAGIGVVMRNILYFIFKIKIRVKGEYQSRYLQEVDFLILFRITLTNTYGSVIYPFRFRLYTQGFANSNQTDFMYQPVALFIGLRYMRGRAADRFGRFVSGFPPLALLSG